MQFRTALAVAGACACVGFCSTAQMALAQTTAAPVIYPAKDQSARQQDQDRYACFDWARGQSGYDPTNPGFVATMPASAPMPAATVPGTTTANTSTGTMARGAAGGAAVAELAHRDASRGAAAGLLGASLADRMKQKQQQQQQQQAAQSQQMAAAAAAARPPAPTRPPQAATYDRAFAACMEARGYVVK